MPPLTFPHAAFGLIFGPLGVQELLIILLIAILIFGGRKIPEIGKGLGEGIRQFKSSLKGEDKVEEKKDAEHTPASHGGDRVENKKDTEHTHASR